MVSSRDGPADPDFIGRLRRELDGEVLADAFSRARYSTDASFYRIVPLAVAIPRTAADIDRAIAIAREASIPVVPRGAGTSQCGQTIGRALVIDTSKHLRRLLSVDEEASTAVVEPGLVLDQLNAQLNPRGLQFPVDPATSSRATLGGMAGNNSAGARSIRYGMMVDNVRAIEATLADGEKARFEAWRPGDAISGRIAALVRTLVGLSEREADELAKRIPDVMRHVAGYNLHRVSRDGFNAAQVLVGSEGTLAFFTKLHLKLSPLPRHLVLGVCHFPTLRTAMESVAPLVELKPSAVELIDSTFLNLARESPQFSGPLSRFVRGTPEAVLLVEFSGDDPGLLKRELNRLEERMGDLGFEGGVLRAETAGLQSEIWSVRKAGMNIVMSMKGDGKPVAFIEDCVVPLNRLADYTERVTALFAKHGTRGVWYAHASVGCLHVRPILNMKEAADVRKVRAIAEATHELIREFGGSHSGEHGDGILRSEFIEPMLGPRLSAAFAEIKHAFDPGGLFNPGKIVNPPRMDDRSLLRFPPDETPLRIDTALDWSEWGGLLGATEMCNNNGACRKADPGVMCPSYRATRDERDLTRGRANTLRDVVMGRLGPEAMTSQALRETFDLCISCKACRRECPTGVDVARMKIEVLHHQVLRHGLSLKDRLIGYLPRYAPMLSWVGGLANLAPRLPGARALVEGLLGLSARRSLPQFQPRFRPKARTSSPGEADVILFVDTFSTYFEPAIARSAQRVLEASGVRVGFLDPPGRPPCCGRTFLAVGLVEEARAEARRFLDAYRPWLERNVPLVGIEPSCLLTLRDEWPALLPGPETRSVARLARTFEEQIAGNPGALPETLRPQSGGKAWLHGHCHQKAFGAMDSVQKTLALVPGLSVETIDSGCCGMAGAFGFDRRHFDTSMQLAEMDLLPAVRAAGPEDRIVASGTSCRHQIADGAKRHAVHVAELLAEALRP